jgi:hypothetical protein
MKIILKLGVLRAVALGRLRTTALGDVSLNTSMKIFPERVNRKGKTHPQRGVTFQWTPRYEEVQESSVQSPAFTAFCISFAVAVTSVSC